MPIKPAIQQLNGNSVDILNAIRTDAPQSYKDYVPVANENTASIREIGAIIMSYQPLQNDFLKALVNRIGRVIITSKMYSNPWASFKKGMLEFGETVEDIFVNLAKPHQYDPSVAENELFKRENPDVKAAFHYMNYQKFYKTTVNNDQLRQAFLSWGGITDLISKIIDAMYTGANYDEFCVMKYLIARTALNGNIYPKNIPSVSADHAKEIVATIKGVSNMLEFLSPLYNMTGVSTFSEKKDQYLIMNAAFDATIDVEVLASAFNLDKAEFMGHRVLVDDFSSHDAARLAILFANDPSYVAFTSGELLALKTIPCVILDKDWFMIFDNFFNFTEQYNGEGLYWNYWLHVWKTFSVSPFANGILFTTATPAITSVSLSPATATLDVGEKLQLTTAVVATGFADTAVIYTLTGASAVTSTISTDGFLTVAADEANATLTVTATSEFDNTKSDTSVITVGD